MKQFLHFSLVGVFNTALSFAIFVVLLHFNVFYLLASIIAYITGIVSSYLLNSAFVFKKRKTPTTLFKFVSVYLTALAINLLLLFILVDSLGFPPIPAQLTVTALVLFYNYMFQKRWTFNSSKQ